MKLIATLSALFVCMGCSQAGTSNAIPSGNSTQGTPGPSPTNTPRPVALHVLEEPTEIHPAGVSEIGSDLIISAADNYQDINNTDAAIFRISQDGTIRWAKKYAGRRAETIHSQKLLGSTVHVFGGTNSDYTGAAVNEDILWTQWNVSDGELVNGWHLGTTAADVALASAVDGQNIIIVGASGPNAFIAKLNSATGSVSWAKSWIIPGLESFDAVQAVPDGYIATGLQRPANSKPSHPIIAKFDLSGNHLWSTTFVYGWTEKLDSLQILPNGEIFAVGFSQTGADILNGLAVKLTSDGRSVAWAKLYSTSGKATYFKGSSLQSAQFVFVGGYQVTRGATDQDALVMSLSTTDGAIRNSHVFGEGDKLPQRSSRETIFHRSSGGVGFVYSKNNARQVHIALGDAAFNFGSAVQVCTNSNKISLVEKSASITIRPLTPTVTDLVLTVTPNTSGLFTVNNLGLARVQSCN